VIPFPQSVVLTSPWTVASSEDFEVIDGEVNEIKSSAMIRPLHGDDICCSIHDDDWEHLLNLINDTVLVENGEFGFRFCHERLRLDWEA